jgi:hypothetical protein
MAKGCKPTPARPKCGRSAEIPDSDGSLYPPRDEIHRPGALRLGEESQDDRKAP